MPQNDTPINYSVNGDASSFLKAMNSSLNILKVVEIAFNRSTKWKMPLADAKALKENISIISQAIKSLQASTTSGNMSMQALENSIKQINTAFQASMPTILKYGEATTSFSRQSTSAIKSQQTLNNILARGPPSYKKLTTATKDQISANKSYGQSTHQVVENTKDVYGSFATLNNYLRRTFLATIGYKIGEAIAGAVASGIDFVETTNLFTVSMGKAAGVGKEFVNTMSDYFYLDPEMVMRYTGTFNLLARSLGLTTEQAQKMSQNLFKLGTDLSSMFNVDFESVMEDLQSGMTGQTRVLYKYGIDTTRASLAQTALAKGMDSEIDKLTQGEKMFLRYETMLKQTTLAQGDLARTMQSPINMTRALEQNTLLLKRAFGEMFVPLLTAVLPTLIAFTQILTNLFNTISAGLGYSVPTMNESFMNMGDNLKEITDDGDDTANSLKNVAKQVDNLIGGFDEINKLDPKSGTIGRAIPTVGGMDLSALSSSVSEYSNLMEKIKKTTYKVDPIIAGVLASIATFLGATGIAGLVGTLGKAAGAIGLSTGPMILAIAGIAGAVGLCVAAFVEMQKPCFETADALDGVSESTRNALEPYLVLEDNAVRSLENVSTSSAALRSAMEDSGKSQGEILDTLKKKYADFAESAPKQYADMGKMIITELMKQKSGINTVLTTMFNNSSSLTDQEKSKIMASATQAYTSKITTVQSYITQAETLIQQHYANGTLGEQEFYDQLSAIQTNMNTQAVTAMSDSAWEQEKILGTLKDNASIISAEEAANVVKNAYKTRDDSVQAANDTYWERMKIAKTLREEGTAEAAKMADEIEKEAKKQKDAEIKEANDCLIKTVDLAKKKSGGFVNEINWSTGQVMTKWQKLLQWLNTDFAKGWSMFWATIAITMANIVIGVINTVKGLLNGIYDIFASVGNIVVTFVNELGKGVKKVGEILGKDWGWSMDYFKLDPIEYTAFASYSEEYKRIEADYQYSKQQYQQPKMATGGVVTAATNPIIGEGKYSEAVIPLGNSPELSEMLDKFAERVPTSSGPTQLTVYLGSQCIYDEMVRADDRDRIIVGG